MRGGVDSHEGGDGVETRATPDARSIAAAPAFGIKLGVSGRTSATSWDAPLRWQCLLQYWRNFNPNKFFA